MTATPNYQKRTFTLRKNGVKYRTGQMDPDIFQECIYNTAQDWAAFLLRGDYYLVK